MNGRRQNCFRPAESLPKLRVEDGGVGQARQDPVPPPNPHTAASLCLGPPSRLP